jgi:hypothetical protein
MSDELKHGAVYEYEGRLWRCGLVNDCRARLDPMSAATVSHVGSGRTFQSYGSSINIGPKSYLKEVDPETLTDEQIARFARLVEREEQNNMAKQIAGVPVPPQKKGDRLKELNAERQARLAETKAATRAAAVPGATPKLPGSGGGKGPAEKTNDCKCGCGGKTASWFIPGHDARFKGWLLKIERGQQKPEDLMTPEVRQSYTWRKKGNGLIPTTNYKGEPHNGYLED